MLLLPLKLVKTVEQVVGRLGFVLVDPFHSEAGDISDTLPLVIVNRDIRIDDISVIEIDGDVSPHTHFNGMVKTDPANCRGEEEIVFCITVIGKYLRPFDAVKTSVQDRRLKMVIGNGPPHLVSHFDPAERFAVLSPNIC